VAGPSTETGAMKILPQKVSRTELLWIAKFSSICALAAAVYGAIHDQISFTISPIYFDHYKFKQFWFIDFGLSPRIFVALIGALATCWFGFALGWFLARVTGTRDPESTTQLKNSILVVIGTTIGGGIVGATLGWTLADRLAGGLDVWQVSVGPEQYQRLVAVVFMHWGSYTGAAIGAISVALRLRLRKID
jgi:hypothetical protein